MASIDQQSSSTHAGSTKDAKRYFAGNTGASVLFFAFNILTAVYFVPFQLHYLHQSGYGIVGVANAVVSYLQALTFALLGTTFRFVTMNLARGDREEADSYASTHLAAVVYAIVVLLPICAVVSYFTPGLLKKIPPDQIANTRILFFLCYANFTLLLAATPYQLATYLRQRFDIRNLLDIANQVFRYSTWVVVFAIAVPQLWYIGLGYMIGSAVALVATMVAARRLTPDFRPSVRRFDMRKFVEMARMGGWVGLDALGNMLYWSTDLLIITRMLGPAATGRYVVVWGFAMMLRSVISMMGAVIAPTTVAAYARHEWDAMRTNLTRAIKFISLGLALMLGILCGLGLPFLTWWLRKEIPDASVLGTLSLLMWLMIAHLVANSALEPINALTLAANKVAAPCIATIVSAVIKIALSVLLIKFTSLGMVAVAIAGLITFTLRQLVFGPIYAGRLVSASSWPIYRALVPGALLFAAMAAPAAWLASRFDLATLPRLAGVGFALLALGTIVTYFVALNDRDRRFLAEVAPWGKRASQPNPSP